MEQSEPGSGAITDAGSGPRRLPNGGTLGISDARWAEARRRAAVIAPLAALQSVSASTARDASGMLGLSERTIYGLLRLWQRSGGLVTSLAPELSSGGRGKSRVAAAVEQFMKEAIRDEYLSKQKKRAEAVVRAVRDRCRAAGISLPAANTVRARVRRVRADKVARVREGSGSAAAHRLTPVAGETPPAAQPMAILQVDHTPVDLILVDETWRKPIGRPWLSVAIDTYSRCVAGLHLPTRHRQRRSPVCVSRTRPRTRQPTCADWVSLPTGPARACRARCSSTTAQSFTPPRSNAAASSTASLCASVRRGRRIGAVLSNDWSAPR